MIDDRERILENNNLDLRLYNEVAKEANKFKSWSCHKIY